MALGDGAGAGKTLGASLEYRRCKSDLDEVQVEGLAAVMLHHNSVGHRNSCRYGRTLFVFTHSKQIINILPVSSPCYRSESGLSMTHVEPIDQPNF